MFMLLFIFKQVIFYYISPPVYPFGRCSRSYLFLSTIALQKTSNSSSLRTFLIRFTALQTSRMLSESYPLVLSILSTLIEKWDFLERIIGNPDMEHKPSCFSKSNLMSSAVILKLTFFNKTDLLFFKLYHSSR